MFEQHEAYNSQFHRERLLKDAAQKRLPKEVRQTSKRAVTGRGFFQTLAQLQGVRIHISLEVQEPCADIV